MIACMENVGIHIRIYYITDSFVIKDFGIFQH